MAGAHAGFSAGDGTRYPRRARLPPGALSEDVAVCACPPVASSTGDRPRRACVFGECTHLAMLERCVGHSSIAMDELAEAEASVRGVRHGVRVGLVRNRETAIFARVELQPGHVVAVYIGERWATRPPADVLLQRRTLQLVAGRERAWLVGDGARGASAADHGCNPNAAFLPFRAADGGLTALLATTRRVRAGDRITARYGFEDAAAINVACRCAARECCGLMGCTAQVHAARVAAGFGRRR
jgi:hypothetical protein